MKKYLLLSFLLATATIINHNITYAQGSLTGLDALKGKWAGTGWYQMGPGPKSPIEQTEHVYSKLDGKLLVIEGRGVDPESGNEKFAAYGVLNYSAPNNTLLFNAYTQEGYHTMAHATLDGNIFTWWFDKPNGGTIKYIITFDEHTWSEDGLYSPDGNTWYTFFHMDLKKQE